MEFDILYSDKGDVNYFILEGFYNAGVGGGLGLDGVRCWDLIFSV